MNAMVPSSEDRVLELRHFIVVLLHFFPSIDLQSLDLGYQ
jgi:hypothetical protein